MFSSRIALSKGFPFAARLDKADQHLLGKVLMMNRLPQTAQSRGIQQVVAIAHQPASISEVQPRIHGREGGASGQIGEPLALEIEKGVGCDEQRAYCCSVRVANATSTSAALRALTTTISS